MTSQKKSSFQKKTLKNDLINGTKSSLHNSQLLISSGIPSFDSLIGGGLPVGSLILLNEDEYGGYAKVILKYFLAEGIVSNHDIYICSLDADSKKMILELPNPVNADIQDDNENEGNNKKMTIAWRYENLKTVSFSLSGHKHFGHYFDLSKSIEEKYIKQANITYWSEENGAKGQSFCDTAYNNLLNSIKEKLKEGKYLANQVTSQRNILRIVLHHMGSPLWNYDYENEHSNNSINFLKFMYSLRALIRNSYATCVLSIPFSHYGKTQIEKCIHLSDITFQLQSFAGTEYEKMAPYKDYHGFFIIQKLAAINSLITYNPQVSNLAFKLRKKKFVIEEFSLPPELENSTEREQDDLSKVTCSQFKSQNLDF